MKLARILVVGSGGREHALAWRLARDPEAPRVEVAPGSPGMEPGFTRLPLDLADPAALVALARERLADLVVIGPEGPLAAGAADALRAAGIRVFGPSREAARLESSKWFAKEVVRAGGIPTARAEAFDDADAARAALGRFGPPWVIKADGLAAGKGVLVTLDETEAASFVRDCLSGVRFGPGGRRVVLEEFLEGEEASVMAVCDGRHALLLPPARDYKRAEDGDHGSNTGGMGAFAPTSAVDAALADEVQRRIVEPLLDEMERRGSPYLGLLYVGLMIGPGGPRVVEFNARFGDPETQVVMPLTGGSLARLLAGAADGALDAAAFEPLAGAAVSVALVDEGYPESLRGGGRIEGLDAIADRDRVVVFHAATRRDGPAWQVTGGRAAYVTAAGRDVAEARERAYAAIAKLGGDGWRFRGDIAAGAGRPSREEARSGWHAR